MFYRQTTDPGLLSRASNELQAAFPMSHVIVTSLLIATWDAVGYFDFNTDKVRLRVIEYGSTQYNIGIAMKDYVYSFQKPFIYILEPT